MDIYERSKVPCAMALYARRGYHIQKMTVLA